MSAKAKDTGRDIAERRVRAFLDGKDSRAYEVLGSHLEKDGAMFRVWAPHARAVSVVGDFNGWDREAHSMLRTEGGIWQLFVPGVAQFDAYKYAVETAKGAIVEKSDPYAFHAETRPGNASKLYDLSGYLWGDGDWMSGRAANLVYDNPLNIYELHLGSWRRGENGRFKSYREIADELIPYVRELGCTHVELLPVCEHPLDRSWGYQCTGYFAATSRFGTPHDLMYFIDQCHRAGVGVILDWVPAHFPRDGHGLFEFDGTFCYEPSDPLRRDHPEWGTRIFDFGRGEVQSFLISSALFWLEQFHADGLRADAVSSMLYLDYGKKDGQWRPNKFGGRENLEAIEFLRRLNETVFEQHLDALMIAEESTSWPLVTKPVYVGGLGFNLKWNMGWMNDILHYARLDPIYRQYNHKDITFSLMYAFSENYILPLSHDEVVHMKGSLIGKMPGAIDMKFAGVRVFYSYMMAHPGKKLTFMGAEFGQFSEWDFDGELDWGLLDGENNRSLLNFFREINTFYLRSGELWECDFDWQGFEWICHDDNHGNTVAFLRKNKSGGELVFVCNFSPVLRRGYRIGVNLQGEYAEVFNSDAKEFGGRGNLNSRPLVATAAGWHNRPCSLELDLPPLGAVFLKKSNDTLEIEIQ